MTAAPAPVAVRPARRRLGWPLAAPTARGAALLVASLVPLALAVRAGWLLVPGLVVALAAYAVVCADRLRCPGPGEVSARRAHPGSFPVGRPTEVVVAVALSAGRTSGPLLVRDEHPDDVAASAELLRLAPGPAGDLAGAAAAGGEARYMLTPAARGVRRFGRVVVRMRGPAGLATRQVSADLGEDAVVVDPDLGAVGAYESLARRGRLTDLGVRAARLRGQGTEFERVRDAVADDPLRAINWRATARTGRLMASELMPERGQPVVLAVDHGRLMGVAAGSLSKLDEALAGALLLGHVALRSGDRVGLAAYADRVDAAVPARGGRQQLGALLLAVRPLTAVAAHGDALALAGHLERSQRRRALVVMLTDVADADDGWTLARACALLARRHLPVVVTIRDAALDAVARREPVDARAVHERAIAGAMLAEREAVLARLRRSGVDVVDADARRLSPRLVNRYLEVKRRGRL